DSGIGRLAAGINAGQGAATLSWLRDAADPAVQWLEDDGRAPAEAVRAHAEVGYRPFLDALRAGGENPAAAFAAFDAFRVLAAVHDGPRGVQALNAHLARWLRGALAHPADR